MAFLYKTRVIGYLSAVFLGHNNIYKGKKDHEYWK